MSVVGIIAGSVLCAVAVFCISAKFIMRKSWELKKEELESLQKQLEELSDINDELKEQKEKIDYLLNNEFNGEWEDVWRNASKKD